MNGKIGWFVFYILLFTGLLFGTVLVQYLYSENINLAGILGVSTGVALGAFIHFYARRKHSARRIGAIALALTLPIAFTGLVSLLLSLLHVDIIATRFMGIYLLGFIVVLFFILRSDSKVFFQDAPVYDERYLSHFAWASAWSYLFLFFMVIAALIQPWISLDEQGLWIGVLSAAFIFWLINMATLGLKK